MAVEAVRKVIRKNLPKGYAEGMQYGMIGYFVPHELYPAGYHCDPREPLPFAGLASQKNHMSLYLMPIYMDSELQERFVLSWEATGKKLDMGKSCIRFKRAEDVALEVVGEAVRSVPVRAYVERYEANLPAGARKKAGGTEKPAAKKKVTKKKAGKKKVVKKAAGRSLRSE